MSQWNAAFGAALLAFAASAAAGPEKIQFPSDYLRGVLYQTLDRPDTKQYRELYAPAAAVEAVRKGKPIPSGTVLTLVQWSVEQDANGVPLKGSDGRFIKKEIIAHTVMEKRAGWGADYPADWPRNGEWEYASYRPDGTTSTAPSATGSCALCHLTGGSLNVSAVSRNVTNVPPGAVTSRRSRPPAVDAITTRPSGSGRIRVRRINASVSRSAT